jgi:hypothetical protein
MGLFGLDDAFEVVRDQMRARLAADGVPAVDPTYWIVLSDTHGLICEPLFDLPMAPTEVFKRIQDENVTATEVALVSFVRPKSVPTLVAYVRIRDPDDSDVRRAVLTPVDGDVDIGPWERTV